MCIDAKCSLYIVWLDRDATMGQLVSKLKPQLPPQQRDVNYCAIVTSGTNPEIYSLRFPHKDNVCEACDRSNCNPNPDHPSASLDNPTGRLLEIQIAR